MIAQDFATLGPTLIGLGYQITPIRPGAKAPILKDWTRQTLSAAECARFTGAGIGIVCGTVIGIDIDSTDETIVQAVIDKIGQEKGAFPVRIGNAPKALVVAKTAATDIRKMSTAVYTTEGKDDKHQLELLACGQQFVAYGIHPKTGKPYEWTDLMGGLTEYPVEDLPEVDAAYLQTLCDFFEEQCRAAGMKTRSSSPQATAAPAASALSDAVALQPIENYTEKQAQADLSFISADDYDRWITIGQALQHQFGEAGFALWDAWSAGSTKYDPEACKTKWPTFGQHAGDIRPATVRTIMKLAAEGKRERARQIRQAEIEIALEDLQTATDGSAVLDVVRTASVKDLSNRIVFINKAQQRYRALTGATIAKDKLERLMPTGCGPTEFPFTEQGNAMRLSAKYGAGIMQTTDTAEWFLWAGHYWESATDVQIEQLAALTIEELRRELMPSGIPVSQDASKFVAASERYIMYKHMVDILRSRPEILRKSSELDQHPELLVCGNGVVDLRTGAFRGKGRPEDRITQHTAVEYDATAECPIWLQTLDEIFGGNKELETFFQTAVGYTMLGNPVEHVMFLPYGNGANGKSTIINTIRELLGTYACMSSADTFLGAAKSSGGGTRVDLLAFMGRRMIYVDEPDQGMHLKEGLIKSMTGGENIVARALYARKMTEFKPVGVVWMPTNHPPIIRGMDEGIWRRLMPIPFTQKFDESRRDAKRPAKLRAELPGILNWALEGCARYQREGLKPIAVVTQSRAEYKEEMDLTGGWIEACCELDPNARTNIRTLFASWQAYASSTGTEKYLSSTVALGRVLASKGLRPGRWYEGGARVRGFFGIGLREPGIDNGEKTSEENSENENGKNIPA